MASSPNSADVDNLHQQLNLEELEERSNPTPIITVIGQTIRLYDHGVIQQQFVPFVNWPGEVHAKGNAETIVASVGRGGSPHVKVFDLSTGNPRILSSFYAYAPSFSGGVIIDFDPTTKRILTGAGPGGGPHVKEFTLHGTQVNSFFSGDSSSRSGVDASYAGLDHGSDGKRVVDKMGAYSLYIESTGGPLPGVVFDSIADRLSPYNINITTVRPDLPFGQIAHVIVGHRPISGSSDARGLAIVGGLFQQADYISPHTAYVDDNGLSYAGEAEAILHEFGHLAGLEHSLNPQSIMSPFLSPPIGVWDNIDDLILTLRFGRV